jgi:hypothetical protein
MLINLRARNSVKQSPKHRRTFAVTVPESLLVGLGLAVQLTAIGLAGFHGVVRSNLFVDLAVDTIRLPTFKG